MTRKACSRGRLLRIGAGRHATKHSHGSPIKALSSLHNRTNVDETDNSDSSIDYDDGTLDPDLWASDWDNHTQNSYLKKSARRHHLKVYDISDSDSSDGESVENHLPLVSDMIMRPYRVCQSIHASTVNEAELMDVVMGERDLGEEVAQGLIGKGGRR